METRPTSMYLVPWQTARQERLRRSLGRIQAPASAPPPPPPSLDTRWPSLAGRGPRNIPVVGPTEALRGRAGGPGVDVPPGAVPGLLDQDRQSGWQLAQRVWQESGVDWEDTPGPADWYEAPDPYAPEPYSADAYRPGPFADSYVPDYYPDDLDDDLIDPHPTRPDLPVLPPADDSRHGMGPWPVQRPPAAPRPGFPGAEPDQGFENAAPPEAAAKQAGAQAPPLPRRIRRMDDNWTENPRGGASGRPGPGDRGGQAPPLRPEGPAASSAFVPPSPFAPASPFAPSPAFASRHSFGPVAAPEESRPLASAPLGAPVAPPAPPLPGPDELFRAWQGSVDEAVGRRAPRSPRRPAGPGGGGIAADGPGDGSPGAGSMGFGSTGRRGRGRQVAKIGVPAAVIVTVGAGALMMLTGRANDMLAERASSGAASAGQPSASAVPSAQAAGLSLAGYPGGHGTVGVAALWSAGGTTMAVGYADAHPAVWRHATDGTWSLVSTAALGGLTGHLTSVSEGPSGWIAVGSANENGTVEPVVFWSPDGVSWTPQPALTNLAGSGAQFLGVAAGPGGYLVVGKNSGGSQARAALWWSADLKNWTSATSGGAGSFATAAVAVGNGFVAAGSENNCHTIWTSPDGRSWTAHDLAKPSGASTAALSSVAVSQAGRFVAAGYAATSAGNLPIVVTSADGGAHVTQVVLSAPQGQGTVTAVTATSDGFTAVGLAGPANAKRPVEWTSPDGVAWSAPSQVAAAGSSQITALTDTGTMVTGTAQRGPAPSVLNLPAP